MDLASRQSVLPLRVGAVSYLNSKPLVRGLADALPVARLSFDLPSRLADDLTGGRLDVALVPIVEYFRQPEFSLVSDACVACHGPVLSVKLYFRTAPDDVGRLALDEGSRTSAALGRILLANLDDALPEVVPLPIGDGLEQADADAVLLIGDRAMQQPEGGFCEVWDLGEQWCRWTETPFVFAAWVARPGLQVDLAELAAIFEAVRDQGVHEIEEIAEEESGKLGLSVETAREYLSRNLHFTLGSSERQGMNRFVEECRKLHLLDVHRGVQSRLLAN
ncbi:MAG: menaquinone biosynthetic enzyme MqnA/MqnD family protein [Aeoliella sp.]